MTQAMRRLETDDSVRISRQQLFLRIADICLRHVDGPHARCIAEKIVLAEAMGVETHGLHYFLHSVLPLLNEGRINNSPIRVSGQIISSSGDGGIAFQHLQHCLTKASDCAKDNGVALVVLRNPGKIGALRVYCHDLMDRGQLIILMKNTAPTVGTPETRRPAVGTNPLCIGLPGTDFIYDASTSTVATNKLRLAQKTGRKFRHPVGVNTTMQPTTNADEALSSDGFLLPFSFGPYWFKSFFLGVAIEGIAALAGGSTGVRVGEHKGKRLYSNEGMFGLVVDHRAFPDYHESYLSEIALLLEELEAMNLRLPGTFDRHASEFRVFTRDWAELVAT